MDNEFLADVIALLHVLWVLYVLTGFFWTVFAFFFHRRFFDRFWFRTLHAVGVVLVAMLPRFGMDCPLTTIEMYLRFYNDFSYGGSFIRNYLEKWGGLDIGVLPVEVATLTILLTTLAAYLFRPPKRAENWFRAIFAKSRMEEL